MKRLAFYTIGFLHEPAGHPRVQEFVDRVPATHVAARGSAGFIDGPSEIGAWGEVVVPRFVPGDMASRFIWTYSLWRDVQSVYAFAYSGIHAHSLRRRDEWFSSHPYPGFVAWWVAQDHQPDMAEAAARIEALQVHGARSDAFNFRHPFDAAGQPIRLARLSVKTST